MHGPGHGENALCVLQVIFYAVLGEFSFNGVAGTACACALGTSALNHKSGNDPVKGQAVVEALPDQRDKVADRVGSDFRIKFPLS